MLGKCLKHEWIETWLVGLLCCAGVIVVSILAFIILPSVPKLAESDVGIYMLPILIFTLCVMGFVAIAGALGIGRYYFFYRYYKNLFSDQGYLLHTLPVETKDLINSKLIVALIWQYLIAIACGVAFLFATAGIYGMFSDDYSSYIEFMKTMLEGINYLVSVGSFEVILFAILMFLYPIMEVLFLYLAVAIGQLSKKNRFIMSIVALVGIGFVKKVVTNIISMIASFSTLAAGNISTESMVARYDAMMIMVAVAEILAIVGTYIGNLYLVKNKLNLE